MTDSEIHGALVRWLASRTVVPVIQADQSGKIPDEPYIVVRYTGWVRAHENAEAIDYAEVGPDVIATPAIEGEWRFSIQVHGSETPSELLRPIHSAAELNQVVEPLFPGLIIHELSQIRNVPEFVNNAWEPRAQMDMFLRGITTDGFAIDTIEEFSHDISRV